MVLAQAAGVHLPAGRAADDEPGPPQVLAGDPARATERGILGALGGGVDGGDADPLGAQGPVREVPAALAAVLELELDGSRGLEALVGRYGFFSLGSAKEASMRTPPTVP